MSWEVCGNYCHLTVFSNHLAIAVTSSGVLWSMASTVCININIIRNMYVCIYIYIYGYKRIRFMSVYVI
jgi:hypothetical protein